MNTIYLCKSGWFRKVFVVFLALTATGLLFCVQSCSKAKETIKIGVIIPLSGPASRHSIIVDGLRLATDEVNAWGGINGRKLELIIADSKTDPEEGMNAFHEIEAKHHPLLYVSSTSHVSMALAPLAESNRVVLIGVVVATPELTNQKEWVFKYHTSPQNEAKQILRILRELQLKKLGILYQNDALGSSVFKVLKSEFEKAGGSVTGESFPVKHADFKKHAAKLIETEAIYTVGYGRNCGQAIKQLRKDKYPGVLLAQYGAASLSKTIPELNGVYIAAPIIYKQQLTIGHEVKEKFESAYNKKLNQKAANGYDCIKLIAGLLEDVEISRDNVRKLLEDEFIYPSIFGDIEKKAGEHDINFPLFLTRIVDGNITYLH